MGLAGGEKWVGELVGFDIVINAIIVGVGVVWESAEEGFLKVGEIVAIGVECGIGGVIWIEQVGGFPGVAHAIVIGIGAVGHAGELVDGSGATEEGDAVCEIEVGLVVVAIG